MKKELIRTENYLLVVDDSEIWEKIIYHLPLNNSPIIEGVPLLPLLEQEDNVEKIADNSWEGCDGCDKNDELFYKNGYIKGYNKAREKYGSVLPMLLDLRNILKQCESTSIGQTQINIKLIQLETLIQSISQPNMPTHFEFEMEWCNSYGSPTLQYAAQELKNKTTTNSQGQVIACGKYIY